MIVKNEEANLARCLNSVQDLVDEMIIVDTGSTDSTLEIAVAYSAIIYHHVWKNDFSEARNVSLENATREWILILDGDEELTSDVRSNLKSILAQTDAEAIVFKVRNFHPPGSLSDYNDSPQIRVFRNRPSYRYQQRVHNQIGIAISSHGGKLAHHEEELMLWHYGYIQSKVQGDEDRIERSLRMLEEAVNQEPNNIYLNAKLAIIYFHHGDHSLAYTYGYRVLTELDSSQLTIENLRDILRIVSSISSERGYYELAIQTAQSCYELAQEDTDALLATLHQMGLAYGGSGEISLKRAIILEYKIINQDNHEKREIINQNRLAALKISREAVEQAKQAYTQLIEHPQLRPSHREAVAAQLSQARTLLSYIQNRFEWKPPL